MSDIFTDNFSQIGYPLHPLYTINRQTKLIHKLKLLHTILPINGRQKDKSANLISDVASFHCN